jgi:hypothetical protein
MAQQVKPVGVTRVDLVFLLIVLVPASIALLILPRVRSTAYRMVCGTHLSGIGKAMMIYANDYGGEFPRAGGRSSQWTGRVANWTATDRRAAYELSADDAGGQVSVSASLYLLVKHAEVEPKRFLCVTADSRKREKGVTEFKPGLYRIPNKTAGLIDFWDFGPDPTRHVSYAYHIVYGPNRLTTSGEPAFAMLADRNPWMDSPSAKAGDFSHFQPDVLPFNGTVEQAKRGNTVRHDRDGQNVLFLDGQIEFERRSYCGVDNDNIYTSWDGSDKVRGVPPKLGSMPADAKDSLLANDPVPRSR